MLATKAEELKIGDPYTFIRDEPVRDGSGQPLKIGCLIPKRFSASEPESVFEIVAIHHESVYETRLVGFNW